MCKCFILVVYLLCPHCFFFKSVIFQAGRLCCYPVMELSLNNFDCRFSFIVILHSLSWSCSFSLSPVLFFLIAEVGVLSVLFFFHFCFSVVLISCMERGRLSRTACSRLCVSRTVGMYCSFYIHICKEFVCTVQIMFVV